MAGRPKRVLFVASELLGYVRTGGLGTATTFLAVALARMGHRVEVLYLGQPPATALEPEWASLYQRAGVTIRLLPRSGAAVEPSAFTQARATERALRAARPDVVIAQDLAAPAYTALRLRRLGLEFEDTLFVVWCHGTRQWITDMARKVRVLPGALTLSLLERASVELADVVVSPSAYLMEWMRAQGWRLPETSFVIPHLTRSAATGEPPPRANAATQPVTRLTFFGRLEERKGLRPFTAGVSALGPELLEHVELEFLGAPTPAWPPARVEALLSEQAKRALRGISFETELDQPAALTRLARPGTLAVLPSLEDNSPTAVYECLERGIPFIAGDAGGIGELVAPGDRPRVLFQPTAAGVEAALRRALSEASPGAVTPAAELETASEQWARVVELRPRRGGAVPGTANVDVVVVREHESRKDGLRASDSEWIVFLDDEDVPKADFVETLVRAQAASGADVVTCGVDVAGVEHLFVGAPGGLGVVSNAYGTVALFRRSLLADIAADTLDHDWPLLAELSLRGAEIVSIPAALVERRTPPADLRRRPAEALRVVRQFEQRLPREARSLARLAAGLAASEPARTAPRSRVRRALARVARR